MDSNSYSTIDAGYVSKWTQRGKQASNGECILQVEAVIFDFDGVMVDSMGLHLKAWSQAYEAVFSTPLPQPRRLMGLSSRKIAHVLSQENRRPQLAAELASTKREIMDRSRHQIELLPGTRSLIELLRRQGIPFGICSNAPKPYISKVLDFHNLEVTHVVGIDELPAAKPSPKAYLHAYDTFQFHSTPHATLIFEDSRHGLRAAVESGMYAIGISTHVSAAELINVGAQKTYANLNEALHSDLFSADCDS